MFRSPQTVPWRPLLALLAGAALAAPLAATSVIPPDLRKLANESDYVIRGVVTAVEAEERVIDSGKTRIYSRVTIAVREVIAGQPPATIVLEMLGGRLGDRETRLAGAPRFRTGDEDVLFVKDNGRAIFPLYRIMHGRYPILRDPQTGREYVALSNHLPLTDVAQISQPLTEGAAADLQRRMAGTADALTPAQFVARIKAALDPDYVRARQN